MLIHLNNFCRFARKHYLRSALLVKLTVTVFKINKFQSHSIQKKYWLKSLSILEHVQNDQQILRTQYVMINT